LQDGIDDVLGTDRVTVGRDGSDQLTFTSVAYGALQEISIDGGTGIGDLGLSTGAVSGLDVAGTINGVAATGTGQNLRSTDGLNLQVTSTAPVSGVTVTATRGIGSIVKDSFDDLTDVGTGLIPNKEDGLTAIITDITGRIEEGEERLDAKRVRLRQEFVQLEVLLAQFQSQETFLAGQIEGFQATSSANARRGT
jgi:flagellar hook-associated protein 2